MAGRAVFRYEVPVDDRWHTLPLTGPIVHVAARQPNVVEVWSVAQPDADEEPRTFRVFGTGHPLPADASRHVGSALTAGGQLVWHLFEQVTG